MAEDEATILADIKASEDVFNSKKSGE